MLAFQPRGFVFEPVGMRLFFYKYSEAEGSHFFGTMRLFGFVRLFFEIFEMSPKNECIFCSRTNVKKIPKGPFFQNFWHYETVQNSHFLFFFRKLFKDSKESPFNFLKFCNRMDVKKISKGHLFHSFRHCDIFQKE